MAYSSFLEQPPRRASSAGRRRQQVLCINPAAPRAAASARLLYPTGASLLGGGLVGSKGITTPWVELPEMVTGECQTSGNATWLQVTPTEGTPATAPHLTSCSGPPGACTSST